MNPVPTLYPQNLLSNPSLLPRQQTTCQKNILPRRIVKFQQCDIIRTFQDLNESIAPVGFQLKELDNCIIYPFSFDGTIFLKILESIKLDDDIHVKMQYNGMPLSLPQWFLQGNAAVKKEVI